MALAPPPSSPFPHRGGRSLHVHSLHAGYIQKENQRHPADGQRAKQIEPGIYLDHVSFVAPDKINTPSPCLIPAQGARETCAPAQRGKGPPDLFLFPLRPLKGGEICFSTISDELNMIRMISILPNRNFSAFIYSGALGHFLQAQRQGFFPRGNHQTERAFQFFI